MAQADSDAEYEIDKKYNLQPHAHNFVNHLYDVERNYGSLHEQGEKRYQPIFQPIKQEIKEHFAQFTRVLNEDDLTRFLPLFRGDRLNQLSDTEMYALVEKILNPNIDAAIKKYFNSDYAIVWHGFSYYRYDRNEQKEGFSTKWHCDIGPSTHLKIITYFDSSERTGSHTMIAEEAATSKLKEIGYVFNKNKYRSDNINDLTDHYSIDFNWHAVDFKAGDSIIFNPTMRLHRAALPKPPHVRKSCTLCLIPSPVGWRELFHKGFTPSPKCIEFSQDVTEQIFTHAGIDSRLEGENELLEFSYYKNIISHNSLRYNLKAIFREEQIADQIYRNITESSIDINKLNIANLILLLKQSYRNDLNWGQHFSSVHADAVIDLLEFEKRFAFTQDTYRTETKPNPDGIFWPIPSHPTRPRNKYKQRPYARKTPLLNKKTPIGSAGSCFAFEIASYLQDNDYNYVVTELADNPDDGVRVDGYETGSGKAKFSANFGLLFNTPSLKQLLDSTRKCNNSYS